MARCSQAGRILWRAPRLPLSSPTTPSPPVGGPASPCTQSLCPVSWSAFSRLSLPRIRTLPHPCPAAAVPQSPFVTGGRRSQWLRVPVTPAPGCDLTSRCAHRTPCSCWSTACLWTRSTTWSSSWPSRCCASSSPSWARAEPRPCCCVRGRPRGGQGLGRGEGGMAGAGPHPPPPSPCRGRPHAMQDGAHGQGRRAAGLRQASQLLHWLPHCPQPPG